MGIFNYYPEDISNHDKDVDKKIFKHSLYFAAFFIILFWLVKITEDLFGFDFYRAGIFPRHVNGLPGIITSPFIHGSYSHLISNSVPFFILLFTLVYFYRKLSYRIFILIYIFSGICVWLMGRESWHIGASGIVYGLAAFHITSGIIRNDLRLLIISAIVVFLYGGMVWGIFPLKPEISWESHLWGGISGVVFAYWYRKHSIRRKKFDWEEEPETGEETELPDQTLPTSFDGSDLGIFDAGNNTGPNEDPTLKN
jgi:membrane associated rhomboid family serine protease